MEGERKKSKKVKTIQVAKAIHFHTFDWKIHRILNVQVLIETAMIRYT